MVSWGMEVQRKKRSRINQHDSLNAGPRKTYNEHGGGTVALITRAKSGDLTERGGRGPRGDCLHGGGIQRRSIRISSGREKEVSCHDVMGATRFKKKTQKKVGNSIRFYHVRTGVEANPDQGRENQK